MSEYNKNMGGIDVMDQEMHQVRTVRKSYKWTNKVFMRLVIPVSFQCTQAVQIRQWQI